MSINVLMRKLYDPNPEVRARSAMDLGENMAVEAISSLTKVMLNDEEASVRSVCAEALGTIADPSVLDDLLLAKEDEDEKVQFSVDWAIKAIARKLGVTPEEAIKNHTNVRSGVIDRSSSKIKSSAQKIEPSKPKKTIMLDSKCIAKVTSSDSTPICNKKATVNYEYDLADNFTIIIPLCEEHAKGIKK